MGRTAVGLLGSVALATSCSTAGSTASSTTDSESPVVTGIFQQFETTWQPADDLERIEALASSELISAGASVLVPSTVPQGASDSVGRLSIRKTFPTDLVYVDVYVSFQRDQQETALSLTSMAADGTSPTCEERISGTAAGGLSSWEAAEIRTVTGCLATNEVGLTFIEWEAGTNRYHVETRMEPMDALSWLAGWRNLP